MANINRPAFVRDNDHHDESTIDRGYTNTNNKTISNNISSVFIRRAIEGTILIAAIALGFFVLLSFFDPPFPTVLIQRHSYNQPNYSQATMSESQKLDLVLRKASMNKDGHNKTVIMTILNDAWAEPNSIFDLFLESFRIGNDTEGLLRHLVLICISDKAYARCSATHPHCYQLLTKGVNFTNEAFFMSPNYLEMVWRKIDFLGQVLQLGYNFVFTDTDIMWLRNPFQHFLKETDFQISCDRYNRNPYSLRNQPNSGFKYVRSNIRTIQFYKFWYFSRMAYPGLKTQDVLNKIKYDPFISKIGLKIQFLDSKYFDGFCEPSKDLSLVSTMHANCCIGIKKKISDLTFLLEDWKQFNSLSQPILNSQSPSSVPKKCRYQCLKICNTLN